MYKIECDGLGWSLFKGRTLIARFWTEAEAIVYKNRLESATKLMESEG